MGKRKIEMNIYIVPSAFIIGPFSRHILALLFVVVVRSFFRTVTLIAHARRPLPASQRRKVRGVS